MPGSAVLQFVISASRGGRSFSLLHNQPDSSFQVLFHWQISISLAVQGLLWVCCTPVRLASQSPCSKLVLASPLSTADVAVQGSVGLLLAAVSTQPLRPFAPAISWWGHFLGYVIGSLWFTAGAWAQIADVARETASTAAKEHCSQP